LKLFNNISKNFIGQSINEKNIVNISYTDLNQNENKIDKKSIKIHKNQLADHE
jgi:hypothetical protein